MEIGVCFLVRSVLKFDHSDAISTGCTARIEWKLDAYSGHGFENGKSIGLVKGSTLSLNSGAYAGLLSYIADKKQNR